jgi:predicted NUDIX family phosphoesterase
MTTPATVLVAPKKHQGLILAMSAAFFPHYFGADHTKVVRMPYEEFVGKAHDFLVLKKRAVLETDNAYRQLLPYTVVTQDGADGVTRYLPFERLPTAGEPGLHGKVSVGWGGHIDASDLVYGMDVVASEAAAPLHNSTIDLARTVYQSSHREIVEEIQIHDATGAERSSGYEITPTEWMIVNSDNTVCLKHVALVQRAHFLADRILSCREPELKLLPAMTAAELLASDLRLEPWTRFLLEAESNLALHPQDQTEPAVKLPG